MFKRAQLVIIFTLIFFLVPINNSTNNDVLADNYPGNPYSIKVATFNIGPKEDASEGGPSYSKDDPRYLQWRDNRMYNLAKYIAENNYDVVYLQEFNSLRNNYDLTRLMAHLQSLNSKVKYNVVSPYSIGSDPNNTIQTMVILSSYPFVPNSLQSVKIKDNRVVQSVLMTNSPLGNNIRLTNIHTHINQYCTDLANAQGVAWGFGATNQIVAGDLNHDIVKGQRSNVNCDKPNYDQMVPNCTTSTCMANISEYVIDWVYLLRGSNLTLISSSRFGVNPYDISDQHRPSQAYIGTTTPPNPNYIYDTNKDSKFDILDVIYLIQIIFGG